MGPPSDQPWQCIAHSKLDTSKERCVSDQKPCRCLPLRRDKSWSTGAAGHEATLYILFVKNREASHMNTNTLASFLNSNLHSDAKGTKG